MTIYERLDRILATYRMNEDVCITVGLFSSAKIIGAAAMRLEFFIDSMPVDIAEMYAGENE